MCEVTDKIQELKAAINNLPPLHELVRASGEYVDYKVDSGTCKGYGLYKTAEVAVQVCNMSVGTTFPEHTHELPVKIEWLHIVKGKIKVGDRVIGEAESISFKTDEPHKVFALEDVEMIAVTMPADKAYPDAK